MTSSPQVPCILPLVTRGLAAALMALAITRPSDRIGPALHQRLAPTRLRPPGGDHPLGTLLGGVTPTGDHPAEVPWPLLRCAGHPPLTDVSNQELESRTSLDAVNPKGKTSWAPWEVVVLPDVGRSPLPFGSPTRLLLRSPPPIFCVALPPAHLGLPWRPAGGARGELVALAAWAQPQVGDPRPRWYTGTGLLIALASLGGSNCGQQCGICCEQLLVSALEASLQHSLLPATSGTSAAGPRRLAGQGQRPSSVAASIARVLGLLQGLAFGLLHWGSSRSCRSMSMRRERWTASLRGLVFAALAVDGYLALFEAPPGPLDLLALSCAGSQMGSLLASPDKPRGHRSRRVLRKLQSASLVAWPSGRGPPHLLPRPPLALTACTLICLPNWPLSAWRAWPVGPPCCRPGGGRTALGLMHVRGRRFETGGRSEPLVVGGSLGPVALLVSCVLALCWGLSLGVLGLLACCPLCSCRGSRGRPPLETQRGSAPEPAALSPWPCGSDSRLSRLSPTPSSQSAAGGVQPSLGLKTGALHAREPDCSYAGPRVVPARLRPAARSWALPLALFVVLVLSAPVSGGARPCMPCRCPGGPLARRVSPSCTWPCARPLGPSLGFRLP